MTLHLWSVAATYAPDDSIDPVVILAYTKYQAILAMAEQIAEMESPEMWVFCEPVLLTVRGQPEEVTPAWKTELFSEHDRKVIYQAVLEEVSDCIKDCALDECDNLELTSCIGFLDEDPVTTCHILQMLKDGLTVEYLELLNKDEEYTFFLIFATKYKLIDKAASLPVTNLGLEYIDRWS